MGEIWVSSCAGELHTCGAELWSPVQPASAAGRAEGNCGGSAASSKVGNERWQRQPPFGTCEHLDHLSSTLRPRFCPLGLHLCSKSCHGGGTGADRETLCWLFPQMRAKEEQGADVSEQACCWKSAFKHRGLCLHHRTERDCVSQQSWN